MGQRARKVANDMLMAVLAAFSCVLLVPCTAYAYVDPSVMTYTIQALAGVAVALSTVIGVAWRRARRGIYKTFNIDENRGKLVEPDIERIDPAKRAAVDSDATVPGSYGVKAREDTDLRYKPTRWWKRMLPAFLISAFATGTLFVVAPYELVAANSASLIFGLDDIWAPVALSAAVVEIILFIVMLFFRGKAFRFVCAVVLAFGLCCWAQALFLNFALPAADGSVPNWDEYTTVTVESALVWVLIFAVVLVFALRSSWKAQRIMPLVAVAMIVIQGAGIASLFMSDTTKTLDENNAETQVDAPVLTKDGLFDLAPDNNVVVFVLDTTDTSEMKELIVDHPEDFKGFEDFVFFADVSGSMIPTRYCIPFLLTGELPDYDEDFMDFYHQRYERSSFIKDISEQGYSIGVYTDSVLNGTAYMSQYAENIHTLTDLPSLGSPEKIVFTLWKCAMYRDMTWLIKPQFWFYTDEVNNALTFNDTDYEASLPYNMNDALYYSELKERGLEIIDDGSTGDFRLIHLLGSHYPYVLDENANPVSMNDSDLEKQTLGVFHIINEYLQQMKDLGVYDSSTIIITSDHGHWDFGSDLMELERSTSPIMLIKPANPENPGQPLQTSEVPITHGHFHPTVIEAIGGDASAYGTPALEEEDNDQLRYYLMTIHDGKVDSAIKEYVIDGDASDIKNWKLTGREWKFYMDGTIWNELS